MKEIKHIIKPWGYEKHIEINNNYVVKEIGMSKDCCCSLQYHEFKLETIYVVKGNIKLTLGEHVNLLKDTILSAGQSCTIEPRIIHRMSATEDSIYIEASTNFLDDVIRLEDKYGRV